VFKTRIMVIFPERLMLACLAGKNARFSKDGTKIKILNRRQLLGDVCPRAKKMSAIDAQLTTYNFVKAGDEYWMHPDFNRDAATGSFKHMRSRLVKERLVGQQQPHAAPEEPAQTRKKRRLDEETVLKRERL
jgi:hypothetical protein